MDKRTKILIVEDQDDILDLYRHILKSVGYAVAVASNGEECMTLVRSERPDLILLDVMMPDVNGIDLCRQIKGDPDLAATLIIHISGRQISADNSAEGLNAGADGYLLKPVDPQVLIAHVNALIRLKTAEDALSHERELRSLDQLAQPFRTTVTARLFDVTPLKESHPEVFRELVDRYGQILESAMDERAYRVQHNVTESLRTLVERLGFLRAVPRDIVDIHSKVIKTKIAGVRPQKAKAYIEEGRLRVLEIMGHLASYYRTYSLSAGNTNRSRSAATSHSEEPSQSRREGDSQGNRDNG